MVLRPSCRVEVLASLACAVALLVVDAVAGPGLCTQDLSCPAAGSGCAGTTALACDDPGPALSTTAVASLLVALLDGAVRATAPAARRC